MARLMHIVFDTHMGNGHAGLAALAGKKINVENLGKGECVVFINRAQTALKMFASGGQLLLHYKSRHGAIDADVIRHLPNHVDGGTLNYGAALKASLKKRLRQA